MNKMPIEYNTPQKSGRRKTIAKVKIVKKLQQRPSIKDCITKYMVQGAQEDRRRSIQEDSKNFKRHANSILAIRKNADLVLKKNKVRRTVDLSAKPEKSHIKILEDLTEFTKDTLPIIREKKESGLDVNYGISHNQQQHFDKYVKVKFGLQLSKGNIKQKTPSKRNVLKALGKLDTYHNYRQKESNSMANSPRMKSPLPSFRDIHEQKEAKNALQNKALKARIRKHNGSSIFENEDGLSVSSRDSDSDSVPRIKFIGSDKDIFEDVIHENLSPGDSPLKLPGLAPKNLAAFENLNGLKSCRINKHMILEDGIPEGHKKTSRSKSINVRGDIKKKLQQLTANFSSGQISPSSWRNRNVVSANSNFSLFNKSDDSKVSFVQNNDEMQAQLDFIQQKYGLTKELGDLKSLTGRKMNNKTKGILHSTLAGLMRKKIVDIDLYRLEKPNDFFSVNQMSKYMINQSRAADLGVKKVQPKLGKV